MALANFQRISFDEANPALVGAERGQKFMTNAMNLPLDLKRKMLANEIAKVQAQYAEPNAKQNLLSSQLSNQKMQELMPYLAPKEKAELEKMQLANQLSQKTLPLAEDTARANINYKNSNASRQSQLAHMYDILTNPQKYNNQQASDQSNTQQQVGMQQQSPMNTLNSQGENSQMQAPQEQNIQPTEQTYFGVKVEPRNAYQGAEAAAKMHGSYDNYLAVKKQEALNEQKDYRDSSNTTAQAAQTLTPLKSQVMTALNISDNIPDWAKGPGFGKLDPNGWLAAVARKGDPKAVDEAQKFIAATNNIKLSDLPLIRNAMGGAIRNVTEFNFGTNLGMNPTDSMETRLFKANNIFALSTRAQELENYWDNYNKNPQTSPKHSVATGLLQNHNEQWPLTNDRGTFLPYNAGHLGLYQTPRAIKEFEKNGSYKPSKQEIEVYDRQHLLSKELNRKSELYRKTHKQEFQQSGDSSSQVVHMKGPKGEFDVPLDQVKNFEQNNYIRVK